MNIRSSEIEITAFRPGSRCYLCNTFLDLKPSKEHIIPKALGNNLMSPSILCGSCNNSLGTEIDSNLSSYTLLHHYAARKLQGSATFASIKRLDGARYQLQDLNIGDIRTPQLIQKEDHMEIQIPSNWPDERAEKWVRSEMRRLGYGEHTIKWDQKKAKRTMLDPRRTTSPFIERATVRGVVKSACNWWVAVCDYPVDSALIQCIQSGELPLDYRFRTMGRPAYHYQFNRYTNYITGVGQHFLCAVGVPSEGLAYVDISLFGVQTFRIIIDYSYCGPEFTSAVTMTPFDNLSRHYDSPPLFWTPRREIVRLHFGQTVWMRHSIIGILHDLRRNLI